jgi:hypothetical protein
MNEWLKPHIQESEAGMEVTSYLPAELDRASARSGFPWKAAPSAYARQPHQGGVRHQLPPNVDLYAKQRGVQEV